MRLRDIVVASACALLFAAPAMAQTTYTCVLSGASETPANGSAGTGNGTVVLNAAQTQLSISVQYQSMTAAYTASHIHGPAPLGTNAGVRGGVIGTPAGWVFGPGSTSGTITNFLVTGITATDVSNLNAGLFYVNIHSQSFPGGELRGQLGSQPVPTMKSTWRRVKQLFR